MDTTGQLSRGNKGVTQGDPLFPTILNVVVDAVVRHWVTGFIADAEERGDLGKEGRHQATMFYADYGTVASPDPRRLTGVAGHADCLPENIS